MPAPTGEVSFIFDAQSEADTDRLGVALASVLPRGTVVALDGSLGAGKTRLVRAIAEAYGVPEGIVASPTFVLWGQYQGRELLHHLDAYRIRDNDEFEQLGVYELFDGPGIVFIEWADRVAKLIPDDALWIAIESTGDTSRRFELRAQGERQKEIVERVAASLGR